MRIVPIQYFTSITEAISSVENKIEMSKPSKKHRGLDY